MRRAIAPWLLAFLLLPSASAVARAEDSQQVGTSQERAEKGDLTEINKQLTNSVSELWSITFQQNNFRISPGIPFDQGERWNSNLLFQPVSPIALTPEWNLITRPVIPLFVSQPHPQAADPTHVVRTTAFGDIIGLSASRHSRHFLASMIEPQTSESPLFVGR